MAESDILDATEFEVVTLLAKAWDRFEKLPVIADTDRSKFSRAIYAAERIVLARPVLRRMRDQ